MVHSKTVKRSQSITENSTPPVDALPALQALRQRIADLRVRSEAARHLSASGIPMPGTTAPMVPVFQTPIPAQDVLTCDRDVERREEKIRNLLSERGPRRLLGAMAGPTLAESITDLYRTHPNFGSAIDLVLGEERMARQRERAICGLRLLLTGEPGIGKTDFAQTLAGKLGVPMIVIGMSAAQSAAALAGSEAFWGNSRPGQVWESLVQGSYANPLIVLDEIEKAPSNWGDPAAALYQLMEPRTASQFIDKSVPWLAVDASRINWIGTANDITSLHEAIVSRFVVIHAEAPAEEQLRSFIQSLYADLLKEHDLADQFPEQLNRECENALLGSSIREVKRRLRVALGVALRTGSDELVIHPIETPLPERRIGFI